MSVNWDLIAKMDLQPDTTPNYKDNDIFQQLKREKDGVSLAKITEIWNGYMRMDTEDQVPQYTWKGAVAHQRGDWPGKSMGFGPPKGKASNKQKQLFDTPVESDAQMAKQREDSRSETEARRRHDEELDRRAAEAPAPPAGTHPTNSEGVVCDAEGTRCFMHMGHLGWRALGALASMGQGGKRTKKYKKHIRSKHKCSKSKRSKSKRSKSKCSKSKRSKSKRSKSKRSKSKRSKSKRRTKRGTP